VNRDRGAAEQPRRPRNREHHELQRECDRDQEARLQANIGELAEIRPCCGREQDACSEQDPERH